MIAKYMVDFFQGINLVMPPGIIAGIEGLTGVGIVKAQRAFEWLGTFDRGKGRHGE